jgi:RNA polymerase sigma-70 factor (ECF subfamily)
LVSDKELRDLCEAGRLSEAASRALSQHGPEIMSFLTGSLRDEAEAGEAFAIFCGALWETLPSFRWECSFRTWSFVLARHAIGRLARDRAKSLALVGLPPGVEEIALSVRSATPSYLKTETRNKLAALRGELDPDDQQLLILRVNKGLPWDAIARVILGPGEQDAAAIARTSASLRKRFERVRARLKALAAKA